PDGNFEIYLYNTTTGAFTQITNTITASSFGNLNPAINADGTRIAYGFLPDPSSNSALFLYDTTTGVFTQITTGVFPDVGSNPAINANGTRITYAAGNGIVDLYDTTTGTATPISGGGNNEESAISADGTRIAMNDLSFSGGFDLYDT